MRPRDVLAANLRKLQDAFPAMGSVKKLSERTGIPNGTVGRIRTAAVGTSVDQLEQIAQAFKLEPWQLLCEGLQVTFDADGRPRITGLPSWPFALVPETAWKAYGDQERGYIQRAMLDAMKELATRRSEVLAIIEEAAGDTQLGLTESSTAAAATTGKRRAKAPLGS